MAIMLLSRARISRCIRRISRRFMDVKYCERKFLHMSNNVNSSYEEAIQALNGLQSNAAALQKSREEKDINAHKNLTDTKKHLETLGIKLEDLDALNVIHISGTKGKGSTCAFVESILRHHGYKTGFYSSPHLISVSERIRINGKPFCKEKFALYFWHVYGSLQNNQKYEERMPPYFMFLTIMAFYVFIKEKVDVAVIEVGIGGLYDCTNFIQYNMPYSYSLIISEYGSNPMKNFFLLCDFKNPVVVGVTSLGIDHVSILGNTIKKIASQKAGIFKPNVPVFTVPQPEGGMDVLQQKAQALKCPIALAPPLEAYYQNDIVVNLGVPGDVQSLNASLALQICRAWLNSRMSEGGINIKNNSLSTSPIVDEELGRIPPPQAEPFQLTPLFLKGLQTCVWPGRFQTIKQDHFTYYLDGAHTSQSMKHCVRWFNEVSQKDCSKIKGPVCRVLLFNCIGERNAESLLHPLAELNFDIAIFSPNRISIMKDSSSDQSNFMIDNETEMQKCENNRQIWCHLMSSLYEEEIDVLSQTSISSMHNAAVYQHNHITENSVTLPCLSNVFNWISSDMQSVQTSDKSSFESSILLLKNASHVQVLVTGSLHLIGGVLSIIDPDLKSTSVMEDT